MTPDTKRALDAIQPMANVLGISVNADDRFLYCNGRAIGILDNSTYATVKEFIGYAMYHLHCHDTRYDVPPSLVHQIKKFWFSDEQIKKLRLAEEERQGRHKSDAANEN